MITGLIVAVAPMLALMGYMAYEIVKFCKHTAEMKRQLKALGH